MEITRRCILTWTTSIREIDITDEQLVRWHQGALIQDVAPQLSADDREFIISGITPETWERIYGRAEE